MMHDRAGQLAFQAYSADGSKAINSISRHGLNAVLLDAAAKEPGVVLHFEERAVGVGRRHRRAHAREPTGRHSATHDVIDRRRRRLQRVAGGDRAQRAGRLPPGAPAVGLQGAHHRARPAGGFALDPGALHIWPRGDSMMIALPNPDHSFTATLFWPFDGPAGFAGLDDAGRGPGPLRPRLPRRHRALRGPGRRVRPQPVGTLVTVRVWPWSRGRLALLGDAAHAIVPFFGQGMNCAFEDVVELDRCLDETGDDWTAALAATPSGASRTPTPSPSWRSTTSSRCATRSARRCSASASGSSTPSSGGRPTASSRCTSW